MNPQEANAIGQLIGSLGFPIVIVLGALWFIKRDLWPWYVKRMEARDAEENSRHDRYMETMDRFTGAINGINATINGLGQIISVQTDKMDDYHAEIMRELRIKRG